MGAVIGIIYWGLNLFLITLIGRLILDYVRIFSPNWRPRGIVLALAELIYSNIDNNMNLIEYDTNGKPVD